MCRKHQRHCVELEDLAELALREWAGAETLDDVRACWGRLGGLTTLHRYGPGHFALLARHRWGAPEALPLMCARMQRRRRSQVAL